MTDSDTAGWRLVQAAALKARNEGSRLSTETHYGLVEDRLEAVDPQQPAGLLHWNHGWQLARPHSVDWLEPCLPLASVVGERSFVVGQLGQSLDGFIATQSGHSHYVTGRASLLHLHRLRALCDAVVVGAGTIDADDPQLTTRLVDGQHPVRVVLDRQLRLAAHHRVFTDSQSPTLRLHAPEAIRSNGAAAGVEEVAVAVNNGTFDLHAVLDELRRRGLHRILVEGGGRTVSAFLRAGLLDRIHVVVAPFFIGEGRPGIRLPATRRLDELQRPIARTYRLGDDVLFDCDLRGNATTS